MALPKNRLCSMFPQIASLTSLRSPAKTSQRTLNFRSIGGVNARACDRSNRTARWRDPSAHRRPSVSTLVWGRRVAFMAGLYGLLKVGMVTQNCGIHRADGSLPPPLCEDCLVLLVGAFEVGDLMVAFEMPDPGRNFIN